MWPPQVTTGADLSGSVYAARRQAGQRPHSAPGFAEVWLGGLKIELPRTGGRLVGAPRLQQTEFACGIFGGKPETEGN
jgi:hypothetical protein